jgi:hypothetical protein
MVLGAVLDGKKPNHSFRLFLMLDNKPFWPNFVHPVFHTYIMEVFENKFKTRSVLCLMK